MNVNTRRRRISSRSIVTASLAFIMEQLWVPSTTDEVWSLATVNAVAPDGKSADVVVNGAKKTVPMQTAHPWDPSHDGDFGDVGKMGDLHEAPLLAMLERRYARDAIYTWSGEILLSLNPYRQIDRLYDVPAYMQEHGNAGGALGPPHIFAVADRAYALLRQGVAAQALVVNGESGAGKTESCRQLMRYISEASSATRRASTGDGGDLESPRSPGDGAAKRAVIANVERCTLQASYVLEAFGNAKTIRNNNSSRFGKLTWLLFSPSGTLLGSRIQTSLIEKSRLCAQGEGERNFSVFYQMAAGLPKTSEGAALATKIGLGPATGYAALTHGKCTTADGIDDAAGFGELVAALKELAFTEEQMADVWTLLHGLLRLGDASFVGEKGGGHTDSTRDEPAVVKEKAPLEDAAAALGCTADHLEEALTSRTVQAGRAGGSVHTVNLSAADAADARDALVKRLYELLFHWVVLRINEQSKPAAAAARPPPSLGDGTKRPSLMKRLSSKMGMTPRASSAGPEASQPTGGKLGLLDIYGFENLGTNSLEQLCINFANELLQRQFNETVFVLERKLYDDEGVDVTDVTFRDNSGVIQLLCAKPAGIFPLLEEQGKIGERGNAETFKSMLYEKHLNQNMHFTKPRYGQTEFVVRHFAGDITYDPSRFLVKNVDELHADLQLLVSARVGGFVATVVGAIEAEKGEKMVVQGTVKGVESVSIKFQRQMAELMAEVGSCRPHYVRCVKPNAAQAASLYERPLVRQQLHYLGVMETVRIRRQGFPVRVPFDQVAADYAELCRGVTGDARARALAVLAHLEPSQWRAGTTKVFMREGATKTLATIIAAERAKSATALQTAMRRRAAMAQTKGIREENVRKKEEKSATAMQTAARGRIARTERRRVEEKRAAAALTMQRVGRGYLARKFWVKMMKATLLAQATAQAAAMKERFQLVMTMRRRFKKFLKPQELVVVTGLVKRLDLGLLHVFSEKRRQLVFTSLPRLICFDENLEAIEWEMPWSLAVEIKLKENPKEFTVSDGNQKAKFLDVLGNAARWKAAMGHTQISDGTGSAIFELVKSDDYQPETMLRFQGSLIKRSIHTEAGSARWQKRWVALSGKTLFWFKSSDAPSGQLELTPGTRINEYSAAELASKPKEQKASVEAHPHAIVVMTPELKQSGLDGLVLQV